MEWSDSYASKATIEKTLEELMIANNRTKIQNFSKILRTKMKVKRRKPIMQILY